MAFVSKLFFFFFIILLSSGGRVFADAVNANLTTNTRGQESFYVADSRDQVDPEGQIRTDSNPDGWATDIVAQLPLDAENPADVLVYVHGFRTGSIDTLRQAEDIASSVAYVDHYVNARRHPIFIHFKWRNRFTWQERLLPDVRFGSAQESASGSALLLTRLLESIRGSQGVGHLVVLAHSLGGQVVMDSLALAGREKREVKLVDGLALIQAAIPAVSIRCWTSRGITRFPAAEVYSLIDKEGRSAEPVEFDYSSGCGTYSYAAAMADKLIYTTAEYDSTLSLWYELDENFLPKENSRPRTLQQIERLSPYRDVSVMALGNPFPDNPVEDIWKPLENPMARLPDERQAIGTGVPELSPYAWHSSDPTRYLEQTIIYYFFEYRHPNVQSLALENLVRPNDWHSPLEGSEDRLILLQAIWTALGI